ncbi:MAG: hypothetical protein WC752_00845 [Patescibacteria group bacterium]|jgi:nucleotidyltransferase/DNA polymerase involved in DNA repair
MSYSKQSTVPIELLPGIGQRTALVLRKFEIKTIGQFKQMPEKVLVEIFGPSIKKAYWQTHGINARRKTRKKYKKNPFYFNKILSIFV